MVHSTFAVCLPVAAPEVTTLDCPLYGEESSRLLPLEASDLPYETQGGGWEHPFPPLGSDAGEVCLSVPSPSKSGQFVIPGSFWAAAFIDSLNAFPFPPSPVLSLVPTLPPPVESPICLLFCR